MRGGALAGPNPWQADTLEMPQDTLAPLIAILDRYGVPQLMR